MSDILMQMTPFFIWSTIFAVINYKLASKIGSPNAIVMAILSFIPIIGIIPTVYLLYHAIFTLLDRTSSAGRPRQPLPLEEEWKR